MEGKRILALDYGTKRIGVALSDELGWTAQPLETLNRRTLDRDIAHIASLVVTKDLIGKLNASDLIKEIAAEVGGTGGGRPEIAIGGGKDPARLDSALEKVFGLVERMLERYTNAG